MQRHVSAEELHAAARHLARTERGRTAMQRFVALIDADDLHLDLLEQRAFLALLGSVWTGHGAEVRATLEAALSSVPPADLP